MNPRVVDEAGFVVVGIEARTTNAGEMTPEGIIGRQWQRFMAENLLAQIPNRVDSSILAVYTDYASDKDGEYTFVLGARVASVTQIPTGMVARRISAGRYVVFTTERGPAARVVPAAWKRIWDAPLHRAYRSDFELHDERAADPQNAQVRIYVGIH